MDSVAVSSSKVSMRRKRGLDEYNSGGRHVQGPVYGNDTLPPFGTPSTSTLFRVADENGYPSTTAIPEEEHLLGHPHPHKSRRTYSEPAGGASLGTDVGLSLHSSPVVAPLHAMSTTATSNAVFHPPALHESSPSKPTTSLVHPSNQLENFQLGGTIHHGNNNGSHNGNSTHAATSMYVKPVARRCLATNNMVLHTPRAQPAGLPSITSYLSPKGPCPAPSTTVLQEGHNSLPFGKLAPAAATVWNFSTPSFATSWKADALSKRNGLVPASQVITTADYCSSDEELAIENQISMSQDKLQNLSVQEIPEDLLRDSQSSCKNRSNTGADQRSDSHANDHAVMQLCPSFYSTSSAYERQLLEDNHVFTIPLTTQRSPIMLGRDQFVAVFGDKIRGVETFHISRRHCVFHVTTRGESHQVHVVVENTSTNGLDVNGRALKHGERCELGAGDKVTLLKFRSNKGQEDTSLTYVMSYQKQHKRTPSNQETRSFSREQHPARRDGSFQVVPPAQPKIQVPPAPPQQSLGPTSRPIFVNGGISTFPDISVDILIADPVAHSTMLSRHPPSRGFRDELSSIISVFSSVNQLQSEFGCATSMTLAQALGNNKGIVVYAGGSESDRVVTEDDNGMPSYIEKSELSRLLNDTCRQKLLIVFARSIDSAQLFVNAGFPHVIFVNASDACRPRATSYLRALLACLLKGSTVHRSHIRARGTALGYAEPATLGLPCVCGILPGDRNHDILLEPLKASPSGPSISTLNAALIPMLAPHFVSRETEIADVIQSLRTRKVSVCSLHGEHGVGKSSIAVHVAKYALDRNWYRNGVHYMNVASEPEAAGGFGSAAWLAIQRDVEQLLQHMATSDQTSDLSMLLVLDGCDALEPAQLHTLVVNTLQVYPKVQILISIRKELKINASIEEQAIEVRALSPEHAAELFLSTARACLAPARLQAALPSESVDGLIGHAAITRLKGMPLLITKLAFALKQNNTLDDLR